MWIVVFSDGETWSPVDDCVVINVTEKQFEKLEEGVYPKDVKGLKGVRLEDVVRKAEA